MQRNCIHWHKNSKLYTMVNYDVLKFFSILPVFFYTNPLVIYSIQDGNASLIVLLRPWNVVADTSFQDRLSYNLELAVILL